MSPNRRALCLDKTTGLCSTFDMARLAKLVIPGMPHHVTQRGNRRQQTFFNDGDYLGRDDCLVEVSPLLALAPDGNAFVTSALR